MKKRIVASIFLILSTPLHSLEQENILEDIIEASQEKKEKEEAEESTPEKNFDEIVYGWSRTFAEVLQLTNQKHYQIKNAEKGYAKAIDAFLNHLDPHSNFLDPDTYKNILQTTSGEFFGVGIVIDNTRQAKDKFLTIVDTIPDGPADKVGVKPYDKIVEVDGDSLEGMSTEEATSKLKGERNSEVEVKILRENQSDLLTFEIVRDVIKEQTTLSFYIKDHNIYYLSLSMFSENAIKQIQSLLKQANKKKYKGLILDLRNNSGGLLTSAIDIAGLFLEKESLVVTTKDKFNNETERYITSREPAANNGLPIFILMNNYTASAAEILAGVLKIHSDQQAEQAGKGMQKKLMVFLAGTKTFGKGSVQEVIPVSNNSAIKITTSLYYLPNDTSIQGLGIEPDFLIERRFPPPEQVAWFTKNYGREQALSNYINPHKTKKEKEKKKDTKKKPWAERARETLEKDNQFRDAIALINILDTAKRQYPKLVSNRFKAIEFLNQNFVSNGALAMEEVKS